MLQRFTLQGLKFNISKNVLLFVILPLIILRLCGLLEPLEWASYDLFFGLRPTEPKEERIVLVVWDETDLQMNEESTISDATLAFTLKQIKQQQPRVIGLDLYRDIPVPSYSQTKQENEAAYLRLTEIFRSTPNLIGIEKAIKPTINPPTSLKEMGRVASADLIPDKDHVVRRAFIDAQPVSPTGETLSAPYLGVVLAYQYLVQEGWQSTNQDRWGSLKIYQDKQKIILKQIKNFDGPYINNRDGLDFLINWRKNKISFVTVSIADLVADSTPENLFHDKIVIIGNVASSTADRHITPLQRGNSLQPWIYGVNIPAQVASSIVSAALDHRPLMAIAGGGVSYWLLGFCSLFMAWRGYGKRSYLGRTIFFHLIIWGLIVSFILFVLSYSLFLNGYFLPIILPLLAVWGTLLVLLNEIQFDKERQNTLKLKSISRSLSHELNNSINRLQLNLKEMYRLFDSSLNLASQNHQEDMELGYEDSSFLETKLGQKLNLISSKLNLTTSQLDSLKLELQRTNGYIQLIGSHQTDSRIINVNNCISQIVQEVVHKRQNSAITLEEQYDPELANIKTKPLAIEIIALNLISNAVDAIEAKKSSGILSIQTVKKNHSIEIIVKDNGIGIPSHLQSKIFAPFISYKSDRSQGLGLTIVNDLLTIEGGQITVKSRLNEGSSFIVSLPI